MEEAEAIEASDGTRIRLEVAMGRGLTLVAERDGDRREVPLSYPSAGFGGHRFVLSPGERWLAFAYYSGQSQEAYQLFSYPDLELRWSMPYVFGESGLEAPGFTPDERYFVSVWATNPSLEIVHLLEQIDSGEVPDGTATERVTLLEWGRLHLRDLDSGATHECSIRVRMPVGSPEQTDPEYWPKLTTLTNEHVSVSVGWRNDATIALPPPDAIILDGPKPATSPR